MSVFPVEDRKRVTVTSIPVGIVFGLYPCSQGNTCVPVPKAILVLLPWVLDHQVNQRAESLLRCDLHLVMFWYVLLLVLLATV